MRRSYNGVGRDWNRSDSSSPLRFLQVNYTFFDFHLVGSALTSPRTTPGTIPPQVKTTPKWKIKDS